MTLIRQMKIDDYARVYQLWINTKGMGLNDIDDSQQGIARMLERNPTLSFVAEADKKIVGVIIAGQDGRRGYIYHTAVHQDYRHQRIAQKLVRSVLNQMEALIISKVGLFIFQDNYIGNEFWQNIGFNVRRDIYYRDYGLIELERIDT